jgi:hypothetical protein
MHVIDGMQSFSSGATRWFSWTGDIVLHMVDTYLCEVYGVFLRCPVRFAFVAYSGLFTVCSLYVALISPGHHICMCIFP